jgi:vacuolar-type H+-ATPase catalytic subunit A/Vma1
LEKKKASKTVPVQAIIPRTLYAELVKICAESDYTIKDIIQDLIEDFVKHDKLLYREVPVSDEQFKKAMTAYEIYLTVLDEIFPKKKGEKE